MSIVADHIATHPVRLLVTTGFIVIASWFAAGAAIVLALEASHDRNVEVCRQVNELRREIYVAAADLQFPAPVRERFLPTEKC